MAKKDGPERRRAIRYPSRLFILFQASGEPHESLGRGVVVDVSHLGLAVETEVDLSPETTYDCFVEMPIKLKVKVVRRYTQGQLKRYGMEILGQGFFDKIMLRQVLKSGDRKTKKL